MASITIDRQDLFPSGTTVGAYDATGYDFWPGSAPGSAAESATADSDGVEFTALTRGRYFAAAQVGGEWKYVLFTVTDEDAGSVVAGTSYYVDVTNGNDSNDGESWNSPFATLQAAIDACTADVGDVITVKPGSHAVDATVEFNKAGIIVRATETGRPGPVRGEGHTVNASSDYTDGPAATITAPCRIEGLGFAGRDLTKESLLIDCEEAGGDSGGSIELYQCRFSCWYGALDAGIRIVGGSLNVIEECSFDGLFGGFGTAGIIAENDGAFTPAYLRVLRSYFYEMGSGNHAIKHASGSTPLGVLYAHNYLLPGFGGNTGKFLDNNSVAATGTVADNWTGLADKAASFENLGGSSLVFADNHYDE